MSHDIFISHSSKDKTIADAACACLESRGLRCWIAPRDIVAGADWGASIIDGINGAKAMVLVLSSHSNVSKQVLREIERAANRGISVLPFRVEDVVLSKSLEYFLSSAHWLDAYHGPIKHNLEKLANNAAIVVERQDAVRPLDIPPPTPRWISKPYLLAAAVCGVALFVVAAFSAMTWRSREARALGGTSSSAANAVAKAQTMVSTGIGGQDLLPAVAKKLGISSGGVGVTGVSDEQKCGIRSGDVIVRFRDKPISKCSDLVDADWGKLSIDEEYSVTVIRDGSPLELTFRPSEYEIRESGPNDAEIFCQLRRLDAGNGLRPLSSLATTNDTVVVTGVDKKAFAWRPGDKADSPFEIDSRTFSAVASCPDGRFLLSDARTGELVFWDPSAAKVVDVMGESDERVFIELFVTQDGKTAVAADEAGDVLVWDLEGKSVKNRFSLKDLAAANNLEWLGLSRGDLSLTANGRHLGQRAVTEFVVWDTEKLLPAATIGSEKRITASAISPDGRLAAIALDRGLIEVWDVASKKRTAALRWHTNEVCTLLFLSPNHLVSSADSVNDASALVWDLRAQEVIWGYTSVESSGLFAFGPQFLSLNRQAGTLYIAAVSVREVSLPVDVADSLRSFVWAEDTYAGIATSSQAEEPQSVITATFGDGASRQVSQLADGSSMSVGKDTEGKVTSMEFQPGRDVVGLGILLGADDTEPVPVTSTTRFREYARILDVPPGGQAARDGTLHKDDRIIAVFGSEGQEPTPVPGMFLAELQRLVGGREGTSVRLLVRRGKADDPIEVVATRGAMRSIRSKPAKSDYTNSIGMEFVAIPGGLGTLGVADGTEAVTPHYVRLSKGFLIGVHEVTQDEFASVMASRPSAFATEGAKSRSVTDARTNRVIASEDTAHHPVDSVSWEEASEFCKRLSLKEGRTYRLPTEAEWEWACRNGGKVEWRQPLDGAWIDETAVGRHLDFPKTTFPVGSRSPNDAGVYDMLGNVAEWCSDRFAEDGFATASFVDPQGPRKGLKHVVRGGSFDEYSHTFFERSGLGPSETRPYVGFRVLLELSPGVLGDKSLERVLLDDAVGQFDEGNVPNPIPPLRTPLRTADEEKQEFDEICKSIDAGDDLVGLRDRFNQVASANQRHCADLRGPWIDLNVRLGNFRPQQAMSLYNESHMNPSQAASVSLLQSSSRIDPLCGWACNDLAWCLATNESTEFRDPPVAVLRAVDACKQAQWQYWGFLDTLAAALAASGNHDLAVRVGEAAMERAPENERAQLEFAIGRYSQKLEWAPLKP